MTSRRASTARRRAHRWRLQNLVWANAALEPINIKQTKLRRILEYIHSVENRSSEAVIGWGSMDEEQQQRLSFGLTGARRGWVLSSPTLQLGADAAAEEHGNSA